ncbi:hypothetical protein [Candidatus Uabimicrobium sp. HlEnr_7]|uniref:hypothetical protein n=1 Tax=Candidatus Uabimicrobium helgolandensis TaxID=3095367 RepID=UPI003556CC4C
MIKYMMVLLFAISCVFSQEINSTEEVERTNWLFYLYQKIGGSTYNRVIPLYSYNRNSEQASEDFFLWPLLIGYEMRKNPYPEALPFAKQFRWYSVPILTISAHSATTTSDYMESNTLVSFSLLSFYQSRHISEKYFATSWFSLPALSYYNRELLYDTELEIDHVAFGGPLFLFEETLIRKQKKIYSANNLSIDPSFVAFGKDGFKLLQYQNWGKDSAFKFISLFNFSFFEISTTFHKYPGSRYEYFKEYDLNPEHGFRQLYLYQKSPTTRLGFLSPFIQVESNPNGKFSWQFLPFFHYISDAEGYQFSVIPFGMTFGSKGIEFSFQPKLFPFVYRDDQYNRWDILWPLIRYQDNPEYPQISLQILFLFEYNWQQDSEGTVSQNFNIVEQFLFHYSQDEKQTVVEVLPFGILFSFLQNDNEFQWRLAGFGYSENQRKRYLQILFFSIAVGSK